MHIQKHSLSLMSLIVCFFLFLPHVSQSEWVDEFVAAADIGGIYCVAPYGDYLAVGYEYNQILLWDGISWDSVPYVSGSIRSLIEFEGDLIVGGDISYAGGVGVTKVARWDGTTWSPMGDDLVGQPSFVRNFKIYDGVLYAVGHFYLNPETVRGIAFWDGSDWQGIGSSSNYSSVVEHNGILYFGGDLGEISTWDGVEFTVYPNLGTWKIADMVNHLGVLYCSATQPYTGDTVFFLSGEDWIPIPSEINMYSVQLESYCGDLYATGYFTSIEGVPASRIAKWDGSQWSSLGDGLNNRGLDFCKKGEGLYVCGQFTEAGGQSVPHIARWDSENQVQLAVDDVPLDQGGELTVSWARHPDDFLETSVPITDYYLQKMDNNSIWVDLANTSAQQQPNYSIQISTEDIFVIGEPEPWGNYRIASIGQDSLTVYYSAIDSAYSIDNIVPPKPDGWIIEGETYRIIACNDPSIPDMEEVCFYRGVEAGFVPEEPIQCSVEMNFMESHLNNNFYRIQFSDIHGNLSEFSDELILENTSGTADVNRLDFGMEQNHPNPFNPSTTISFTLPSDAPVSLRIYDVAGKLVRDLVSGQTMEQGTQQAVWNGQDDRGQSVSAGIYFYKLTAGNFTETRRMALVK